MCRKSIFWKGKIAAKRYLIIVFVVLSLLTLLVPAYGVANAKSPKPQDQVKNFMNAAAGLKASKAAGYWVPEENSNVTSQLANLPSGTKISLSKLKLVVTSQAVDTSDVNATYTIKVQLRGQKKAQQSNLTDIFNLKLVNGIWLISGTTMWDHLLAALGITSSPTATPTTTAAPTTSSPTTSVNPIKLGGINSWSGPTSMSGLYYADSCIKTVENQVKDQGGILGGRQVQVVRYDNRGSVAEAQAGVKKLVESDKVSALVFGGTSAAEQLSVADAADQYPILFCAFSITDYKGKIALQMGPSSFAIEKAILYSAINIEKAKTIAFLGSDMGDTRERVAHMKESCSTMGLKVVYENYAPIDTQDFTSYLTKIKYEKPDYLYVEFASSEPYITIAKQIKELGGLGDTKVGGNPAAQSAAKQSGAEGWYLTLLWFPGSTYTGSVKFETDFKAAVGKAPESNHVYFYMALWTAVHAIELAGTDNREAVIQAAHSGKLEWETPAGFAHWSGNDQFSDMGYNLAHVEGGKIVQVPMTQ